MKTQQTCKKVSGCWPSRHTENLEYEFRLFWTIPWSDLTSQFFHTIYYCVIGKDYFLREKISWQRIFRFEQHLAAIERYKSIVL